MRRTTWKVGLFGAWLALLTALVLPTRSFEPPPDIEPQPFRWDRTELFRVLAREFEAARSARPETAQDLLSSLEGEGRAVLERIRATATTVPWDELNRLEAIQFRLATLSAAEPRLLPAAQAFLRDARAAVLQGASVWPQERPVRESVYRIVQGGRAATEEAVIQALPPPALGVTMLAEVSAVTPSLEVHGVRVHSGDMLLSRGGAPTSALIARGNDFPGSFSHAALVHVDETTGKATVIESLIEHGTVLSTPEMYLQSTKLRVLLLRLRPDHPILAQDPLAPHRAAEMMLTRVGEQHVGYDFPMEWEDPNDFFCSEVIYHAYRSIGVELWSVRSSMSAPGLVRWLGGMGVRQFTTLVPSDLEYDPRVVAVAEWVDDPALRQQRIDNAIMDALLEAADRGYELGYPWYELPVARLVKGWSLMQGALGFTPSIPSGMRASTALRVNALVRRVHPALRDEVRTRAARFRTERGYDAPYWSLVEFARDAIEQRADDLHPALRLQAGSSHTGAALPTAPPGVVNLGLNELLGR